MKQSKNILRGRQWLMLFAALFAWLLPQQALADGDYSTYVDMSYNYGVSLDGSNTVKIHVPVYQQEGADAWIKDGKLKVSIAGGSEITLFEWKASENIDGDADKCWTNFSTEAGGYIIVTLGNTSNNVRVTKGGSVNGAVVRNNDEAETYDVTALWYVPYDVLGKKLTFKWDVLRNGNSRKEATLTLPAPEAITMPSAGQTLQPITSDAMLSTKFKGQIEVPWFLASNDITKIRYEYTDVNKNLVKVDMPTNENTGVIRLDATVPHNNFRIIASYKMKGEKLADGSYSYYDIENVQSAMQDLTMIHAPNGLTATAIAGIKPKVEVKWNMSYLDYEDFALTDFFEIQRSLTGEEKDFVTIGQEVFTQASKQASYTFVDSTIIESIKNGMLVNGGTLDKLTYRVRRTMSQIWGWDQLNNCATSAMTIVDNLHLLRIANYSAKWEDERAYTVRVSWDYADEYNGVWDDRAKMILHVTSKNGEGKVVEDRKIELNKDERDRRYKVVSFYRPCVHYDVEMYVEKAKSPINFVEDVTDYYFPIHNAADWEAFCKKVEDAKSQDVNARLYADITVSKPTGELSAPYHGTFDGNGHTLTFNAANAPEWYYAPFRFVGNATFTNLHIAGTIKGGDIHFGGLIARIEKNQSVSIINCRSSVTLHSTRNGDASIGGFVGVVDDEASVNFRNCKFDGSFEGNNSSNNGGFVGWTNTNSVTIIENCLFAADHISTKVEGCETWRRGVGTLTLINSHAIVEYRPYIIIRNSADWTTFRDLVEAAKGQYDVDAMLDADVNAGSTMVGWESTYAYRGTFDGNGHTLTFNVYDHKRRYVGPFANVGNATIKNLHTAGTITSSVMYPAGLVGQVINGTATIENCHSSVTLVGTMDGEGTLAGFVGRVTDSNVTISNCKFDGSFEGENCNANGGFVAWVDEKSSATIVNCLFAPDHISTRYDKCQSWARQDSRGTVTVTNCHATRDYNVFPIRNNHDWVTFKSMVTDAKNEYWVDARLEADITITNSVGVSEGACYRGTFDGNGHTLNVSLQSNSGNDIAPFAYVGDANFRNLRVTGKVNGNSNHEAGLIGYCQSGTPTINLDHIWVSAEVTTSETHAGGIIGHSNNGRIYMNDCRFDGKITTNNSDDSYIGCIIGWCNGGSWELHRVYNYASNNDLKAHRIWFCVDHNNSVWAQAWGSNGNSSLTVTRTTWSDWGTTYYNKSDQNEVMNLMNAESAGSWQIVNGQAVPVLTTSNDEISANDLLKALGADYWQIVDGKVVPIIKSSFVEITQEDVEKYLGSGWKKDGDDINPVTTQYDEPKYDPITKPELPDFYHTSNGKIEKTLMTETRQSSVVLSWDTDGNPIDYFTVLRREVGQTDADWQEIATNLDNLSYEDKTVSPIKDYEYKVRATNDCEGLTFSETDVTNGHCKNTGRVAGYVRFNDGTGAAKVKVTVSNPDNGVELATVYTDASGYFVADELPYKEGGVSTTYKVQPIAIKTEQGKDAASVTFDSKSNDEMLRDFIIIDGKRFSGLVWYEGTSIPVKGAHFLVNGMEVHNSAGKPVETDYDGSFSFRVRSGIDTIQVMMDGHKFTNGGYFKGPEGHNFSGDVADIRFYDDTKVKLTGRVVGGNIQGSLPLDNNLSTNNLGDSLKMVLTLEGDNGSWLVYDVTNKNKTQREEVFEHAGGNGHQTMVKTTRKRMEVMPDPATGEYVLKLPPVRWKVEQVYCKGYPTLFQEDQVSEVIDLTDCLTPKDTTFVGTFTDVDGNDVTGPKLEYNAIYNRIYRSPIELTYRQQGFDNFSYFGDKTYTATDLAGNRATVPLAYKGADGQAAYTFGYPVFSLERKYYIEVQLAESYRYNNDPTTERLDIVPVTGGYVTVQNGMQAGMNREILPLDEEGLAVFELGVDQTTQLLSGENALKTVTFTAEQDGTVYEAEPLNGFVLNMFPIGAGVDVMTNGQPLLFDILRDPPGSKSSATLSEGSVMNFSYQMDLTTSAGVKYTAAMGEKVNSYLGTVAAPVGAGTTSGDIFTAENGDATSSEFVFNLKGEKAYSYTMTTSHDITTSSDPTMVGADADLYIGMVQNIQVMPMSTIRAIPDSMYQHMAGRVGLTTGEGPMGLMGMFSTYGSMLHIAEGYDAQGNKFHLVRDESMAYGPKLQSQFIYSQDHILKTVIPGLAKDILKLMYIGTQEEAQAMANSTKRPVYLSLREQQDPLFGVANAEYNTTVTVPNDTTNYIIILPKTTDQLFTDEVSEKAALIGAWSMMIMQNEYQKLTADDLVANYDISGADNVSYSESFETNYTNSMMLQFPFADNPVFFSADEDKDASEMLGEQIVEAILKALQTVEEEEPGAKMDPEKEKEPTGSEAEIGFGGTKFKWKLTPVLTSECLGTYGSGKQYIRKESFSIVPDPLTHLNVDVYRAALPDLGEEEEEEEEFELIPDDPSSRINDNSDLETIFMSDKFKKEQKHILKQFEQEVIQLIAGPQGFVFRTRGGATCNPWEDQRTTMIYEPGQVLDQRTLKINNPKIRIDKQSVSGVSVNDAARFTVYLANESEKPEAVYTYDTYRLFADDMSNPNGAKIFVDGQALTANGVSITLIPGMVTEKTIEVRAGKGFDYEGLRVGIESPTDPEHTRELASFDVHFLREAGGVDIAMPGDKWVINTNAQMDGKRGWYIPVVINGFDKHQHNFDHIEFQYKESQRGDDAWTNLCSYYADSLLMAGANGVREMIPENGNIVTQFYGESWVIEKPYDLRAVVFCRNGNSFLTTASKIISGVKDTRRPQLFGNAEPKSGLLNISDDVIFNFSEDIEYNYLRAGTNFEVKGEVNNNELSETVSVQFTGKASVESEAKRNFSGKDVTIDLMVKPAETGREMPLFSHGTNGDKLQLWLTEDYKLKAIVNDQTFTSTGAIQKDIFTQVALVINHQVDSLTFFNDGNALGKFKMETPYNGTGTLIFGRTNEGDRMDSKYYEGRMMEARLWYRTMDGGLLSTTYGNRRLSGYEQGLVDYYPMNEGSGDYAADKTQGANAKLIGANWAIPRGMSLHLDKEDKGLELAQSALGRTAEQDYTLMFWFKTDAEGRGTLLSNGRGLKEDDGAEHQFHIGFEAEKLMYRSNGMAIEVAGNWSDGQWHHYAMTVNRTRNVANIYVDQELRATFETDSLGGISGGYPLIGASRYVVDKQTYDGATPLKGNIDELAFFAQALPQTLISNFAKKSPNGDEAGLVTYLGFDRSERQSDNTIEMKPYVYSKVIERTIDGGIVYELDPETNKPTTTPARRYEFTADQKVVLSHIDATQAAPVLPYEELTNLKYSFIGRGNQVMVELDEPAAKLNHRNIYVTLYDVEDKYGNTLASPQTATFLVTASSLEWMVNRLDVTIKYGSGESCELPFYNNSATNHTYKIENSPKWLTLHKYSDVIAPQALDYVYATVSKDLNIGTYNEILYLTDEEGITEPFYLNLTIEGEQPEWAENINSELLQNSMNISGQVYLYDELDTDSRDIVGVFDNENQCHGYANISHDALTGENGLFLTVYDNQTSGRELNFRLWQYSTGREIVLTTKPAITFEKDAMLGTDTPVRFDGGEAFVQYFDLKEGWNWVSFNVQSESLFDLNKLLSGMRWTEGDIITELGGKLTLNYENGQWLAGGSTANVVISPKNAYAIKVQKDCTFPIEGSVIKQKDARTITLKQGWNGIGYTPVVNLTVETALSDYYDNAEPGDVIKSHTEFAYFTKSGNTGRWRGSLQYMKPGEGYMMLRKGADDAKFSYPFFELGSNAGELWSTNTSRAAALAPNTMSVSAVVEGFDVEEGDKLIAFANGEQVGTAILSPLTSDLSPLYYLSIAGDAADKIWFAIERDGEIVASTGEVMTFKTNAVIGSPDEPTAISFVKAERENGEWYSISGMKLQKRPTQSGVYIFNGKKVVVK